MGTLRCKCGMVVESVGMWSHTESYEHSLRLTEGYAEKLGVTHRAPLALEGFYEKRLVELGARACLVTVRTPPRDSGGQRIERTYVSELLHRAVSRMGVPEANPMSRPRPRTVGLEDAAMRVALVLSDLYGDAAVDVWWKLAVLHEDHEVRDGVIAALHVNGAMKGYHQRQILAAFHRYAFEALVIQEAERVTARRAELEAELKAEAAARTHAV